MTFMTHWLKDQILTCYFRPYRINALGSRELAPFWGPMGGTTRVYGGLHQIEFDPQPFTYVLLFTSDPGPEWQPTSTLRPVAQAPVTQTGIDAGATFYNNYVGRGWDLDAPVNGHTFEVDTMPTNPSTTTARVQEVRKGDVRAINNSPILFSDMPATTVTHFVVMDGPLAGRVKSNDQVTASHALWYGPLDSPITTTLGASITIPAGGISCGFTRTGPTFTFVDAFIPLLKVTVPSVYTGPPRPPAACWFDAGYSTLYLYFTTFDYPEFIASADIEFHGSDGSVVTDNPTYEQVRLNGLDFAGYGLASTVTLTDKGVPDPHQHGRLTPGVTYTARVRFRNAGGVSDWTNAPGSISLPTGTLSGIVHDGYIEAFGPNVGGNSHKPSFDTTSVGTLTIQAQYEILCQFLGLATTTNTPGPESDGYPVYAKNYVTGDPRKVSGREVFPFAIDVDTRLASSEYGGVSPQNGILDITTSIGSATGWRVGTPGDVVYSLYLYVDLINHYGSPSLQGFFQSNIFTRYNYQTREAVDRWFAGSNINIDGATFGYADDPLFSSTVTNVASIAVAGIGDSPVRVAHSWVLYARAGAGTPNFYEPENLYGDVSVNTHPVAMGLFTTPQVVGSAGATIPAGALKIQMT